MKRIAATLAVVALATGLAAAQPTQGQPHEPLFQRLNLTQQQQDQIQKLRSDFQKKQVQDEAKLKTAQIELRDLLRADNPDRKSIENKIKDIASYRAQTQMDRLDHLLAVRELLTPDQRQIWKERMMNEGMGGPDMLRHPRGMRGPGMGMDRMGRMGQTPNPQPDSGK